MAMTQADIQTYYREHWQQVDDRRAEQGDAAMGYSSPIEDAVLYPIYERFIRDHRLLAGSSRILDIGSGSGRWVRFFLERFAPTALTGMDFAEASVEMLRKVEFGAKGTDLNFRLADITDPAFQPDGEFDLINIANVLFHIPEDDRHLAALRNAQRCLAPGGAIVTTEFLPRTAMRTEWMRVRSRYEFEAMCAQAGLRIVDVRASGFFANDPMGIDGPDDKSRLHFNRVRAATTQLLQSAGNEQSRNFITELMAEVERACLAFSAERIAHVDMPSQKLVLLRRTED